MGLRLDIIAHFLQRRQEEPLHEVSLCVPRQKWMDTAKCSCDSESCFRKDCTSILCTNQNYIFNVQETLFSQINQYTGTFLIVYKTNFQISPQSAGQRETIQYCTVFSLKLTSKLPSWLGLILMMAGDIESNPGPSIPAKWPCGICNKSAKYGSVQCRVLTCRRWFHRKCAKVPKELTYYS